MGKLKAPKIVAQKHTKELGNRLHELTNVECEDINDYWNKGRNITS